MLRYPRAVFAALLCATFASSRLASQSVRDLAAFSSLIVSPIAALPPLANDNGTSTPDRSTFDARYGRWRVDINDAIHDNAGFTFTQRLGSTATSISASAAYLSLSCQCAGWGSAGVSILSQLWSSALPGPQESRRSMHVGLNLAFGGARYAGPGAANAVSASGELELGGSTSFVASSRLSLSVFPGVGVGHYNSADLTGTGTRPMLGAAAAWKFRRGFSIDVGAEQVRLSGGPTQFGAGVSWRVR